MERKELETKILEIVAMAFGKNDSEVSLKSTFKEDLGGASIQMVGLVSEIENELDVMIPLSEAATCVTVAELVDKVEREL